MRFVDVAITTNSAGAGTGYSCKVRGRIHRIQYIKTDYANNVTAVVTTEDSSQAVITCGAASIDASGAFHPRAVANKVADAAALTVFDIPIYACDERVKIVIASGGDTKSGTFRLFVDD